MAKLEILTYPNSVLKQKSKPVTEFSSALQTLSEDMLETMYNAGGVGLAAPQVGELIRMIVIDTRPYDQQGDIDEERMTELERQINYPLILVNPEVVVKQEKIKWEEGCLSVPGYTEEVLRAKQIELNYFNTSGEPQRLVTDGLLSVCIQHEIDHLEGKLFIDRISNLKMGRIKAKIKKYGYPSIEAQ